MKDDSEIGRRRKIRCAFVRSDEVEPNFLVIQPMDVVARGLQRIHRSRLIKVSWRASRGVWCWHWRNCMAWRRCVACGLRSSAAQTGRAPTEVGCSGGVRLSRGREIVLNAMGSENFLKFFVLISNVLHVFLIEFSKTADCDLQLSHVVLLAFPMGSN